MFVRLWRTMSVITSPELNWMDFLRTWSEDLPKWYISSRNVCLRINDLCRSLSNSSGVRRTTLLLFWFLDTRILVVQYQRQASPWGGCYTAAPLHCATVPPFPPLVSLHLRAISDEAFWSSTFARCVGMDYYFLALRRKLSLSTVTD